MKPYYDHAGITIFNGDCLEVLPRLDVTVDMVLADLPYGTTNCAWDSVIPLEPLWEQYRRLIKPNGALVFTASQPFTSLLVMSNLEWFRYTWVWEKSVGTGFLDVSSKPLKTHEDICVFYPSLPTYNPQMTPARPRKIRRSASAAQYGRHALVTTHNNGEAYPRSIIYAKKELGTQHPTQKPVALFEYLIRTYSNPGDLILDNTCGSGTTLRAAKNLGRRAIGVELSEAYCAVAVQRLQQEVLPMFEAAS